MHLYEALAIKVAEWRREKYHHEQFPAVVDILEWAHNPDTSSFRLRTPQLRALETYWYLRLVEETPHIFDLYTRCYSKTTESIFPIRPAVISTEEIKISQLVLRPSDEMPPRLPEENQALLRELAFASTDGFFGTKHPSL